jgi:hypothetical protein
MRMAASWSGLLQTAEYKSVDAMFRAHWQVPLGSSWPDFNSATEKERRVQ